MGRSRDNTARLAKELWSSESLDLEPATFQARFDAIYAVAEGPATLWQLGGAANDYLRAHADAIVVPPELITALVASQMVDGRIIGLKLLNRCSSDTRSICTYICRALESGHEGELYGGLCELDRLLRRASQSVALAVDDISVRLDRLNCSSDSYVRECAERLKNQLADFGNIQD